jgi:hypothetical protein
MIAPNDMREKEMTRLREEIIRTTKEIVRLARRQSPRDKSTRQGTAGRRHSEYC